MEAAGDGAEARRLRSIGALRWALIGLLVASALITLLAVPALHRAVAAGRWPPLALALPPLVLAAFVVLFGAYRLKLVRAGRYPAGMALVQVGLVVLVAGAVAGMALRPPEPAPPPRPVPLAALLGHDDAAVRALAAEVVRHRPRREGLAHAARLAELLDDPSPQVTAEAAASLRALAGRDVGGTGPDAVRRWRAWAASPPAPR